MKILGIESSCDETAASIIEESPDKKKVILLSNVVASSLSLHAKTGGVIPETAAREQLKYILPVIEKSTKDFKIDKIAVTIGPGLIGSLLVGTETAKTLSYVWGKPIIPVNHLLGHIYANFIDDKKHFFTAPKFPAIVLIVSGGHTDLLLMKSHSNIKWLGGTRDDAAGEAFDKTARLLNLPYPGGPSIENAAKNGDVNKIKFPRPMINSKNFDFSFSGLKTAVFIEAKKYKKLNKEIVNALAASTQEAIIDVLISKTLKACKKFNVKSIILSGGVAANQKLREEFTSKIKNLKLKIK
ncbi:tRNA (adenosine(37)-N6)-threonylcarbamoyltransferase complex transferase subunit TsaD, partial [Patescibacteria group bacterium]|nr:tRNA (adenosine(37)-N6)-threonylcarbamoyltransferase complex transferase subunit TsaD [Patescibacteria group bacterium]